MDCKRALVEGGGDIARAVEILRQQGLAQVAKRAGREASQGVVETYVHGGGRIGVVVEVNCETDFVARTQDFRDLAHDLALQIAATNPPSVAAEEGASPAADLPPDQVPLMQQAFIKNPSRTIAEVVRDTAAKTGENIVIRRFARFELGT
jgi:elongation factor Ts